MGRFKQYRRPLVVMVAAVIADFTARFAFDFDMDRVVPFEAVLFLAGAGTLLWAAGRDKPFSPRAQRLDLWLALAFGLAGVRAGLWAGGMPVYIANLVILGFGIVLGALLFIRSRQTS
jgi:hypothetical protein